MSHEDDDKPFIPPPEYGEPESKRSWKEPTEEEIAEIRERLDPAGESVLIPGSHRDDKGETTEIGNDDFTSAALDALAPGTLYRMEREVGRLEGAAGSMEFRPLSETSLRIVLDANLRLSRWVTRGKGKDVEQVCAFVAASKDLAMLVLEAAATHPGTRALKMLVSYPVYLPGLVLAVPGWNACGVFYDEPPSLVGVKPNPAGALDVLDDLVIDFPFKDEASRQNLYAAMLTMVARPAIEGATPFFLVSAPLERTGKGKLIDTALGCAVMGKPIPPMQLGEDEAEVEKRITGEILGGAPIIHFDNIPIGEALDSASLASLATSYPIWKGRILGKTGNRELPNRLVVTMSANNPKATGELVKRTLPIVLAPLDDKPEMRSDFKHEDCYAYAIERRPLVLSALMGIIETGKSVKASAVRIGGFERWSKVVTASLRAAGAVEIMANYEAWCRIADDGSTDMETLVATWRRMRLGAEQNATQILELCEAAEIFPGVFAKPPGHSRVSALSRQVLNVMLDRPVRGFMLKRTSSGSNSKYYLSNMVP